MNRLFSFFLTLSCLLFASNLIFASDSVSVAPGLPGISTTQNTTINLPININGVTSSSAIITGLGSDVNTFSAPPQLSGRYYAGTFVGSVDGSAAQFYCIDIGHHLQFNSAYEAGGNTNSKITYILNNYFPHKSFPYTGSLSNKKEEAGAVQAAIWWFSDGLNTDDILNTSDNSNETLKNRAFEIIADADANAHDVKPVQTLVINIPEGQSFATGTPIQFYVETYNEDNSPVSGVEISVSVTDGSLSQTSVTTNAAGVAGPITLTPSGASTTITANGVITIPQGTTFHNVAHPDARQELVIATPVIAEKEITESLNWYDDIDLSVEKTSNQITVKDGDIVIYQVTVTNDGQTTATGVKVSDILPDILTFNSANGDYDKDSGVWNVGEVPENSSVTLEINTTVSFGNTGATTFNFGQAADYNLFVLHDLFQPSSDTEGKLAVGHDAELSNYSVGDKLPPNSGDVLVVGRKLTYHSGRVFNGAVVYGRFIDSTRWNLADQGIRKDTVIDFQAAKQYLKNLSNQISTLAETGVDSMIFTHLKLVGEDPDLNVFNVSVENINNSTNFTIDVPDNSVTLVNIVGANRDTVSWSGGFVVNSDSGLSDPNYTNLLLNFNKTKFIHISDIGILGSILAPWATLDYPHGVIRGQVIVKNMFGAGQFNYVPFTGSITRDTTITNFASLIESTQPDINPGNNSGINQVITDNITDVGNGEQGSIIPKKYFLYQNYPNPFNPSTTVVYDIPKAGFVQLKVYNILGVEITTLVNRYQQSGQYQTNFDASKLSTGVYLITLRSGNFISSKKMILLK